jgi:hypothetical protein
LEEVVADWYSFQNIGSLQKAFSEWLNLDFRKILREAHRQTADVKLLDDVLSEIIQERHRIIHKLELNFDVRRNYVTATMSHVMSVIDAFVDYLEQTRGMVIRDETIMSRDGEET